MRRKFYSLMGHNRRGIPSTFMVERIKGVEVIDKFNQANLSSKELEIFENLERDCYPL